MTKDKNILIKNIYYMLSYAFTSLNQMSNEDISVVEFDNLHNLFAAILNKGIGQQLKRGLYREYIEKKENLSVMRGKLDINGTIRNKISRQQVLSCEFDELSENNLLNQIIKTTVTILIRQTNVDPDYKDALKKEMLFFSGVDLVDLNAIKWSDIRFQRNNQTYRILISICQLIIQGMLLTTDSGEYKLASFVDEQRMCRLYEKFILEYFSQEHHQIVKVSASQVDWQVDDGVRTLLPIMQTDIMLEGRKSNENKVLIIDAKYYGHTMQTQFDKHTLHSHNLYQIFTYVKNKEYELRDTEPHSVSGMLLYAKTDEELQPSNVYQMSGNQIEVKTLDLNCDFDSIKQQLDSIAIQYFGDKS